MTIVLQNNQSSWWANLYCFLQSALIEIKRSSTEQVYKVNWIFNNVVIYRSLDDTKITFVCTVLFAQRTGDLLKLNPNTPEERAIVKHIVYCRVSEIFTNIYHGTAADPVLRHSIKRVTEKVRSMIDCEKYLKDGKIEPIALSNLHLKMKSVHQNSVNYAEVTDDGIDEYYKNFEKRFCSLGRCVVRHTSVTMSERALRLATRYLDAHKESYNLF